MKPSQTKLSEIKRIYEENLAEKIQSNYVPFVARYGENYDGDKGLLFVGKAENMADREKKNVNQKIDDAFGKIHGDYIETMSKKVTYPRSSFVRTLHRIAKQVEDKPGISHFARTNLYKLATTKTHLFSSEFEAAYVDIFRKEIELLQPQYVVMLTSGLERDFLKHLGKSETCAEVEFKYMNKGNEQKKTLRARKIEGFRSVFITALHPQGKPEGKYVEEIVNLISATNHLTATS
ncbi:MAG: hypothetical protein FWG79_07375 [Bacteroidales bacterium]|nr:hypothetical protein [Bacteroidales bacterium]